MFPRKTVLMAVAICLPFMIGPPNTSAGSLESIQLDLPDFSSDIIQKSQDTMEELKAEFSSAIIQKSQDTMKELKAEADAAMFKTFKDLSVQTATLREQVTDAKLTSLVSRD